MLTDTNTFLWDYKYSSLRRCWALPLLALLPTTHPLLQKIRRRKLQYRLVSVKRQIDGLGKMLDVTIECLVVWGLVWWQLNNRGRV
jgi:hypothetical protein